MNRLTITQELTRLATMVGDLQSENERLWDFLETARNFDPTIEDIKGWDELRNKESEHG